MAALTPYIPSRLSRRTEPFGELSLSEFEVIASMDGPPSECMQHMGQQQLYNTSVFSPTEFGSFEYAFSFSYTDMDPAALFGQFDADGSASLNLGEFQVLLNSALSDGGPDYPMEFISCAFNFLDTQGRCWRAFTHAGDV